MTLAVMGSVSCGLVWGWLLARLDSVRPVTARSLVAMAVGCLILVGQVAAIAPWPAPAAFLGAAALSLLLHLGWLQDLRRRARTPI